MGDCSRCGKKARLEGIEHCRQCLCDVVEKRAKKELSGEGTGRGKGENKPVKLAIVCGSKSSLQCVAAAYLAKKLYRSGLGFEVITPESASRMPKNPAVTAVILAKCADELAAEFLEAMISGKSRQQPHKPAYKANIFKSITEKELRLYANIKNLKYAESNGSWLKQKLLKLHEKYPGTIEALARSGSRVKKLIDE